MTGTGTGPIMPCPTSGTMAESRRSGRRCESKRQAAEDRQAAERDDEGRHLETRDGEPLEPAAGEPTMIAASTAANQP